MEEQITERVSWTQRVKAFILRNKFMMVKLLSVLIGVVVGLVLTSSTELRKRQFMLLKLPGEVLMNMLQCVATPLIMSSVITSVADQERYLALRKAGRGLLFFTVTTVTAVVIGLILALLIKPGAAYARTPEEAEEHTVMAVEDFIFDLMNNLIPEVVLADAFYAYQSVAVYYDDFGNVTTAENATSEGVVGVSVDGPNTLGLIVWSFVFGVALREIGDTGRPLLGLLNYFNKKLKDIVDHILWYLPFGMIFLIASSIAEIDDWNSTTKLGMFILTTIIGLIFQVIVVVLIYFVATKKNPWHLFKGLVPVLVTALLISSSAATLPVTMQVSESVLGIDSKVSRIILPVGANINKDGTAVYEVVAVLFIAQLNLIKLTVAELTTVCIVAAITSIGAPSIPAFGAASTILVLSSVGLPTGDAALLVPVEWVLDRLNTAVNVLGDCYCNDLVNWMMLRDQERRMTRQQAAQQEVAGAQETLEEVVEMEPEQPEQPDQGSSGDSTSDVFEDANETIDAGPEQALTRPDPQVSPTLLPPNH